MFSLQVDFGVILRNKLAVFNCKCALRKTKYSDELSPWRYPEIGKELIAIVNPPPPPHTILIVDMQNNKRRNVLTHRRVKFIQSETSSGAGGGVGRV